MEQKLSRSEREKFKASGKYHSFEDVVTHLQESAEHWAKKGGPLVTARETLLKVLDRLGHFQTLFSIFPSQSAYMSPFCGALKVLLMVCMIRLGSCKSAAGDVDRGAATGRE